MIKAQYKGSIKNRLILIILFVTSITGVIGYSSFVYTYMDHEYKESVSLANTVGDVLSQNIAKLVLLNDVSAAADITSQVKSFSTLKSMVLYNVDKKVLFQYSQDNRSFTPKVLPTNPQDAFSMYDDLLTLYVKASYQDTHLGYVEFTFEVETLLDILKRDRMMLGVLLIVIFFIAYFLAIFYAKQFTSPILQLVKFLEKVELVDSLKQRVHSEEKNEYGKLYEEVNMMLERMDDSQEALKIAAVAFETQSGMTITDKNQKILRVNKAFSDITGYTQEEAVNQTPAILKSDVQGAEFYKNMHESLHKFHHWSGEIHNRHKDGTVYPEHLTIQAVLDEDDEINYYVASFIDLTLQKESEEKLQYLTQYDTLTGLANRSLLAQSMELFFNSTKQNGWGALICFNLKEFKVINSVYGHKNGDLLLQSITKKIQSEFSNSTLIGKIGVDEFALWFSFIDKDKELASQESKVIAEHLIQALSTSFSIDSQSINTSIYSGIALYNEDSMNVDRVFKEANIALNISKNEDKGISFFDRGAENLAHEHMSIYSKLLHAIENEEFELYYQLQYNDKKEVYGAETLIRWNSADKVVFPDEFISIAERTGLILPIGLWVIKSGCEQLAKWQKNIKTKEWVVALNVSSKQFVQEDFLQEIENEISISGIDPNGLKIELTESIFVDNLDEIVKKMKQLQEIGVKISLDDFGTGYSSLEYLKNLPLDQVKIDQSFIRNITQNRGDMAIVKSVLLMGDALGFEVLAEGVETKEHYELLKDLGCKLFQGYYFARPQKIEDIEV